MSATQMEENKHKEPKNICDISSSQAKVSKKNSQPSSSSHLRPSAPSFVSASTTSRTKQKNTYLLKPRVLYVGDSIAHNVNTSYLESKTSTRMSKRKAYSSMYDDRARWPAKNIKDVTKNALDAAPEEDKYEYLVLSAPTVDITNMNTHGVKPSDDVEELKEEVIVSCKNMLDTAEKALKAHPEIKKVLILEHPPRFDESSQDPHSLKPEFAQFANKVFYQLWFASGFKDKIALCHHKIEWSEKTRLKIFTGGKNNRYDGVHMYGLAGEIAYTESVLSILSPLIPHQGPRLRPRTNNHSHCPQTKYTKAQKSQNGPKYSVPVQNRFTVLGN